MLLRRAEEKDIGQIGQLLYQVQGIHAQGRPDIFRAGVRKYTDQELAQMIHDEQRPIFVAVEEDGTLLGYAFCIYQETKNDHNLMDVKTLYIDDLCVDESCRGQKVGTKLYQYVVKTAKETGCYHITLNVWALNEPAIRFYQKCGLIPLKTVMEQIL
jgi:ribosomal protein S18 acetylase RimI-like enzyme